MKRVTKVNIMFTIIILVYIIAIFIINLLPDNIFSYNELLLLPEVVILITAVLACLLLKSSAIKETEFKRVSGGTCLKSVGLAFLCIPIIGLVSAISSFVSGNAASDAIGKIINNPMWLSILLMAVVPAVVEEFVFRGIIFGVYKKRNPLKGALLSALLFGLLHLNINQFSYAFLLGIVLALLDYATESILPGMIMHFTINANSVAVSYLMNSFSGKTGQQEKNEIIQELSNQETASQIANTELLSNIIVIFTYIIIIAGATALAVLLFVNICNKNIGIKSVTAIFKKPIRQTYADEGKYFDGYLVLGISVCVVFILYFDIIVNFLQ